MNAIFAGNAQKNRIDIQDEASMACHIWAVSEDSLTSCCSPRDASFWIRKSIIPAEAEDASLTSCGCDCFRMSWGRLGITSIWSCANAGAAETSGGGARMAASDDESACVG